MCIVLETIEKIEDMLKIKDLEQVLKINPSYSSEYGKTLKHAFQEDKHVLFVYSNVARLRFLCCLS